MKRQHRCFDEPSAPEFEQPSQQQEWTCPVCGVIWREEYSDNEGWFWESFCTVERAEGGK